MIPYVLYIIVTIPCNVCEEDGTYTASVFSSGTAATAAATAAADGSSVFEAASGAAVGICAVLSEGQER